MKRFIIFLILTVLAVMVIIFSGCNNGADSVRTFSNVKEIRLMIPNDNDFYYTPKDGKVELLTDGSYYFLATETVNGKIVEKHYCVKGEYVTLTFIK